MTDTPAPPDVAADRPADGGPRRPSAMTGVAIVLRWELVKLLATWRVRVTLALCLAGPFAFVTLLTLQEQLPQDTLYGRWVKETGLATPLVVLGFVGQWVLPLVAGVVAGDVLSAEDHHGTWRMLLTRSRTRGEVFAGKATAAAVVTVTAVVLVATASLAAGALVVGTQPLTGLSGTMLPAGEAALLVVASWASVLPPALGFAGLALLLSTVTRNSVAGVAGPVLIGLVMQLYAFLGRSDVLGHLLLTAQVQAWHGFLARPAFLRPLAEDVVVGLGYGIACVALAWAVFRGRDEVG